MTNKNLSSHALKNARAKIFKTGEIVSDAVTDKFSDVQYNMSRFVKKNPYKSVAYSLLAGMIISQLFRIRRPRR